MIDSVAGATASPMPAPISTIAIDDAAVAAASTVDVDATTRPDAKISMPVTTTRFVPSHSTSFDDSGAMTIIATANGSVRSPACERRVAEHELQVLRGEEDEAEEREEHERDGEARGGEPRVAEEANVEHRVLDAPLPGDERAERDARRPRSRRGSAARSSRCSAPR